MKKKIGISLVLYNNDYIIEFAKYSLKTILENIKKQEKYCEFIFLVATKKENIKKIKNIFLNQNLEIKFNVIEKANIKYDIVTKNQIYHLQLAKKYNYNFLLYTYADMLFSKNSFLSALKAFNNKKIDIVGTFAMLLNSSNKKFKKFFYLIKNKEITHLKFLVKNKDIIDQYHQLFEYQNIKPGKSFIYAIENNNLFIKTFHYHPLIIKLKNIHTKILKHEFITIDNFFLQNFDKKKIYIENDLSKISIFSYDKTTRTKEKSIRLNIEKVSVRRRINNLLILISSFSKSSVERYLFKNNTLRFPYKNYYRNFDYEKFNFIKYYRNFNFLLILKAVNYTFGRINGLSFKKVFIFSFLNILVIIIRAYQKKIQYIMKKLRIEKKLGAWIFLTNNYLNSDINKIASMCMMHLISQKFFVRK
jgi:hypothetical protein